MAVVSHQTNGHLRPGASSPSPGAEWTGTCVVRQCLPESVWSDPVVSVGQFAGEMERTVVWVGLDGVLRVDLVGATALSSLTRLEVASFVTGFDMAYSSTQ